MKPSSWSNSVSFVLDFAWEVSFELLEDGLFEELCVQGSDSIDSVRAHDRHVCHSDFLL